MLFDTVARRSQQEYVRAEIRSQSAKRAGVESSVSFNCKTMDDIHKKSVGRKRHIAVDNNGRLLMVKLTKADIFNSSYPSCPGNKPPGAGQLKLLDSPNTICREGGYPALHL